MFTAGQRTGKPRILFALQLSISLLRRSFEAPHFDFITMWGQAVQGIVTTLYSCPSLSTASSLVLERESSSGGDEVICTPGTVVVEALIDILGVI